MNLPSSLQAPDIGSEFAGANLGDERRSQRLVRVARMVAAEPGQSFPLLMGADAELEAFYRFVNNEAVSLPGVIEPHTAATGERCASYPVVLAIHDTSEMEFQGLPREGLGPLSSKNRQGFFAHVTLAAVPGETRTTLGVLGVETWARTGRPKGKRSPRVLLRDPTRESLRWNRAVERSAARVSSELLHVMDREADCYSLLAAMMATGSRFVVRVAHDRALIGGDLKLYAAVAKARTALTRDVHVSARAPGRNPRERRLHPARSAQLVKLAISARSVRLKRPDSADRSCPESLTVNIVMVREKRPPKGREAVHWRLVTTEPIETAEELAAIVDAYRSRWLIEELFKALKTGCQYERRQLESRHALEVALGVFLPIAWRLLALRSLARSQPNARVQALRPQQLDVLRACGRVPLAARPSNHEALMALAALGGHIKNNGEPGWLVLGRAYEKLLLLEKGWQAGHAAVQK